jgi:uncharacterized protein YlxW (UPF0749 family)
MLQGILIKKVMEIVMKQLMKQFNLDKIQKYVEEPNELDAQVKSLQKNVAKYGKYIEDIEKDIAIIREVISKNESVKDKFKKLRF